MASATVFSKQLLGTESTFQGSRHALKHILHTPRPDAEHLCVVFSSQSRQPKYHYLRTLMWADCHQLYILDDHGIDIDGYGFGGCWYLGQARDFSFEADVMALIKQVTGELGVARENVIACGSSKGAFCALYYGLKHGLGHVVCGGPTIYLGHTLFFRVHARFFDIAEYIAGGHSGDDLEFLDGLMFDALRSPGPKPNVHLHIGRGDEHYDGHILPFLDAAAEHGVTVELDVGVYERHEELEVFFPPYLLTTVRRITRA